MTTARYLCLALPALAVLIAARARREPRERAGALLAFLAALVGIAALHEAAGPAGWYAFAHLDGSYRGLPVDLWLGWAVLWGPLPVLLRRAAPLPVLLGLVFWVDMVAMPALDPLLVHLGPRWPAGELLGLAAVALPAQLLGRWTADRRRLAGRALLQLVVFTGLVFWLLPTAAFTLGDGGWDRVPAGWLPVLAQAAVALAVPALAAVREFVTHGGGTPFPWDPPRRLVTTGPYAYLANPMQLSATLLLLLLAAATQSLTLAAGSLISVVFAAAVAAPHERQDMRRRHGAAWAAYRRQVRDWSPRLRPYEVGPPGRLWLDDDCGPCTAVAGFFRRRGPGLRVLPARDSPVPLWRARYTGPGDVPASGVAAVARGLGHVTLGWAYAGWFLQLPVVDRLAQLVTDALIAPPHPAGPAAHALGEG
ncbi:hypothetical protein Adi01nite_32300 [Amorphoplanes digitatis]|uniref:Protein-S-isoprenylcysteine O-methyltransferase Ste14 n=1 Tax=Actinoplanes digitatis TaxID=1868 RepID=A0A7W7I0B9_9ACTN|nr:protein-S-isoprenylcysteine O-methyltransferase Ste14 [Actinoplanes digitatis]GID93818.1 hypothetical protein Adi01nite_32300 [Actinoplanes digitatis]